MACSGLRRPSSQAPCPLRTGAALGPAKPIAMRCSHGNLDAVAASGAPNPGKVATSSTPAVCAVNEPADQWRQPAWPGIRWTGFPKAKPAAAAGIQIRLSSATHHGGNASRRGRNRSATAAQVLQDGTDRSSEGTSERRQYPWLAEQPVMHGRRRSVLASESRAYRRISHDGRGERS